jgi:hypothetical protein
MQIKDDVKAIFGWQSNLQLKGHRLSYRNSGSAGLETPTHIVAKFRSESDLGLYIITLLEVAC